MSELPVTDVSPGAAPASADGLPERDARIIPHSLRHASVIGAFSQDHPGKAMVLVAPHSPLPLLKQFSGLEGDALETSYLAEGSDVWRLRLGRK